MPLSAFVWIGASGFVGYLLVGYPAILGWLARRRKRPVRRAPMQPRVSVIVAVHNGEAFIERKLRSVLDLDYPRDHLDIIVASDGSTDRTEDLAREFSAAGVRLLCLPRAGKIAALNTAIGEARYDILVFTDVRQSLARDSLARLVENFADPDVGAVSAELVIVEADGRESGGGLYWRYEIWIRLQLSAIDSIFGATGAYYAMRREFVAPMPPDMLLDDMHLPLNAFFQGKRLIVDARARMFDFPTELRSEFRRKVRTLAGNYQILREYPALLDPRRNRLWFHFMSYKCGRLLLPFALLAILLSSFGLPRPWFELTLAAQSLFYGAALADLWIQAGPFKRITSPIRTFVTLMSATACAPAVFLAPGLLRWTPTQAAVPETTRKAD